MTHAKRTPLRDRLLPDYTKGEEIFNSISHMAGGALGIAALLICLLISARHRDTWAIVSSAVYGFGLIALYSVSSVYHALRPGTAKKVMQVIDHCSIYLLIAATYTPIVLCRIRPMFPGWGWSLFGAVWGLAAMAAVFTAIDLKKYSRLSMACYIGMGWCIVIAAGPALASVPLPALGWILAGGISYTLGAVLYGIGGHRRWFHSVFHIFVVLGSAMQLVGIAGWVL